MNRGVKDRLGSLGQGNAVYDEAEILDELPPALAGDVSFYMYGHYLQILPMFKDLGKEVKHSPAMHLHEPCHFVPFCSVRRLIGDRGFCQVLTRLCRCVTPLTCVKGQRIIEEGKVGSEMYFLLTGECEVMDGMGERLGFLGDGSFFGENPIVEACTGRDKASSSFSPPFNFVVSPSLKHERF